jgi:hypothetical protein
MVFALYRGVFFLREFRRGTGLSIFPQFSPCPGKPIFSILNETIPKLHFLEQQP